MAGQPIEREKYKEYLAKQLPTAEDRELLRGIFRFEDKITIRVGAILPREPVTITRAIDGPDGPLTFEIRERYIASGDVLTLERAQGARTQSITYSRLR